MTYTEKDVSDKSKAIDEFLAKLNAELGRKELT